MEYTHSLLDLVGDDGSPVLALPLGVFSRLLALLTEALRTVSRTPVPNALPSAGGGTTYSDMSTWK